MLYKALLIAVNNMLYKPFYLLSTMYVVWGTTNYCPQHVVSGTSNYCPQIMLNESLLITANNMLY